MAGDRQARIVLKAKDQATPKLKKLRGALGAIGVTAAAVGAVQLGRKLFSGMKRAIDVSAEQELAEQKLAQSIRLIGGSVDDTLPKLKEMASGLQDITGVGDEVILTGQALLVTMGKLTGDGLERATKASLDMAAITGSTESAFDLVSKAASGYTSTLSRYGILIDNTLPEAEKFEAALAKIEEKFGGQSEARLRTYIGRLEEFEGRVGDLQEAIGGPLREAMTAVFGTLLSPAIKDMTEGAEATDSLRTSILDMAIAVTSAAEAFEPLVAFLAGLQFEDLKLKAKLVSGALNLMGVDLSGVDKTTGEATTRFGKLREELIRIRDRAPETGAALEVVLTGPPTQAMQLNDELKKLGVTTLPQLTAKAKLLGEAMNRALFLEATGQISPDAFALIAQQLQEQAASLAQSGGPAVLNIPVGIDEDAVQAAFDNLRIARLESEETSIAERAEMEIAALEAQRDRQLQNAHLTENARLAIIEATDLRIRKIDRETTRARLRNAAVVVGQAAALGRTLFGDKKAFLIAETIANTAAAVAEALPNIPLAVLVGALGAAELATIKSARPQGFARGGIIEGPPGPDVVPFFGTAGETILDTTPQEGRDLVGGQLQIGPAGAAGGVTVIVNGDVIDAPEWFRRNAQALGVGLETLADDGGIE